MSQLSWKVEIKSDMHCGKGLKGDEKGCGGEGSEAVNHGWRKGREEQSYCVVQLHGREVAATEEELVFQPVLNTLGVDLRTRTQKKARRKKCDVRFSTPRRNRAFQCNYRSCSGLGLCEKMEKASRWRLELRRRKKELVSLSLFMEVNDLKVEEDVSTILGAEGVWADVEGSSSVEEACF